MNKTFHALAWVGSFLLFIPTLLIITTIFSSGSAEMGGLVLIYLIPVGLLTGVVGFLLGLWSRKVKRIHGLIGAILNGIGIIVLVIPMIGFLRSDYRELYKPSIIREGARIADTIKSMQVEMERGDAGSLINRLSDSSADTRRMAAEALGNVGGDDQKTAAALAATLDDSEPQVRQAALLSLLKLGAKAESVNASLIRYLNSDRERGQTTFGDMYDHSPFVIAELERIGSKEGLDAITKYKQKYPNTFTYEGDSNVGYQESITTQKIDQEFYSPLKPGSGRFEIYFLRVAEDRSTLATKQLCIVGPGKFAQLNGGQKMNSALPFAVRFQLDDDIQTLIKQTQEIENLTRQASPTRNFYVTGTGKAEVDTLPETGARVILFSLHSNVQYGLRE